MSDVLEWDEDTYLDMEATMTGLCEACGAERGMVEGDADGYECPECGEHKVIGAVTYLFRYADM